MRVTINSCELHVPESCSLSEGLALWEIPARKFAVAINAQFIPRSLYHETQLQEQDKIELLIPMEGG